MELIDAAENSLPRSTMMPRAASSAESDLCRTALVGDDYLGSDCVNRYCPGACRARQRLCADNESDRQRSDACRAVAASGYEPRLAHHRAARLSRIP